MPETFQCPKCHQRYPLKESMAGRTVKCAKCGEAFRVPPAGDPSIQPATPNRQAPASKPAAASQGHRPVAKRLTPAVGGDDPAPAASDPASAAPEVTLDGPLGDVAGEVQGTAGAWESPVGAERRGAPPPIPGTADAKDPETSQRRNGPIAAVILSLLGVGAILGAVVVYQVILKNRETAQSPPAEPPAQPAPVAPSVPEPPPKPAPPPGPSEADRRLDELADESIARMGELNDLLGSARDPASSRDALAKVPALMRRLGELDTERRGLQSQGARLSPQKQQQLDASTKAFETQQLERMTQQMPQYFEELDDLIKEVSPGGPPKKKPASRGPALPAGS